MGSSIDFTSEIRELKVQFPPFLLASFAGCGLRSSGKPRRLRSTDATGAARAKELTSVPLMPASDLAP
jgi:hypothetical protein